MITIPFSPLKGYTHLENTTQQEDYSIGRLISFLSKEIMDLSFKYEGTLRNFVSQLQKGKEVLPVRQYEGIGDLFLATFKPEHRDLVSFVLPFAEKEGFKKTPLMSLTDKLQQHYHYWIDPSGTENRVVVLWFRGDDFNYCPMPYFTEGLQFGGKSYKQVMALRVSEKGGEIQVPYEQYLDQPIG